MCSVLGVYGGLNFLCPSDLIPLFCLAELIILSSIWSNLLINFPLNFLLEFMNFAFKVHFILAFLKRFYLSIEFCFHVLNCFCYFIQLHFLQSFNLAFISSLKSSIIFHYFYLNHYLLCQLSHSSQGEITMGGLTFGRDLLFVYSCLQWDLGIW